MRRMKLQLQGPLLTWTLSRALVGNLAMCANGPVSINFGNVSMLLSAKLTSAFLSSVFFFTNFF